MNAGNALRALGRAGESVEMYRRALDADSSDAEAQNNLGNAFLELGHYGEAIRRYGLALAREPDNADILCNLSHAHRRGGMLEDAIASGLRAVALDPASSIAHNILGLAFAARSMRLEAVQSYRQALILNPDCVEALNNLAVTLRDLGEPSEALVLCAKAVAIDPKRAESHRNLGNVLFDQRRALEARDSYRRALALEPDDASTLLSLAVTLRQLRLASDAEASCRAALTLNPKHAEALCMLGELKADRGHFGEAQRLFHQAIAVDPGLAAGWCGIAAHRKMTSDDGQWLVGAQRALAPGLPLVREISLRYAIGKYFDDLAQYDDAFVSFRLANELTKRSRPPYDPSKLAQRVDQILSSFDTMPRRRQVDARTREAPVFIVGMPRSGTSLTEQILASHPAVVGAGEISFWDGAFNAYRSETQEGAAEADVLSRLARNYLERIEPFAGQAARVVDKMPANFLYAGLIHATLPGARIIHMRRHPIDTCLSIYFQNFFNLGSYANDLDALAHFYREYVRITDHWRAVLPAASLLEISYESLTEDQEGWTRRMLDFLGLPWDSRCLDFHGTERVVITASNWQVRQKLSNASVGRWRHYEKYLEALRHLTPAGGR